VAELDSEPTLEVAARVVAVLAAAHVDVALIGAGALAVHGYSRATEDLDLAVAVDPFSTLRALAATLTAEPGWRVELRLPDADDPLGGVITIDGAGFDSVQLVNFSNPLGGGLNPGAEAVATAHEGLLRGSSLRVVTLPHLIALKLYAGGYKSRLDILELLDRNPGADRAAIEALARRFELRAEWDAVQALAR